MLRPPRSIRREIGAGKARVFSSFEDFVQLLKEAKAIESREDLLVPANQDLLGEILFEWYIQGQIACAFAQKLAIEATESEARETSTWRSVVVPDLEFDVRDLQEQLVKAARDFEAIQVIFVGSSTPDRAVEIIKKLCTHDSWICYEKGWKTGESGDSLLVGLRWNPPGGEYTSWVLAIADFDPMAFTRRFKGAPFIALVLRPGPPTTYEPTPIEGDNQCSHLAHMNDQFGGDEEGRQKAKKTTKIRKLMLLGEEPGSIARAQITFALPAECRVPLKNILRRVPT